MMPAAPNRWTALEHPLPFCYLFPRFPEPRKQKRSIYFPGMGKRSENSLNPPSPENPCSERLQKLHMFQSTCHFRGKPEQHPGFFGEFFGSFFPHRKNEQDRQIRSPKFNILLSLSFGVSLLERPKRDEKAVGES